MTFLGLWGGHMLGKSSEEKNQLLFYYALYIILCYILRFMEVSRQREKDWKKKVLGVCFIV